MRNWDKIKCVRLARCVRLGRSVNCYFVAALKKIHARQSVVCSVTVCHPRTSVLHNETDYRVGRKIAPLTLLEEISANRCPKTVKFCTPLAATFHSIFCGLDQTLLAFCSCLLTWCSDEFKAHVLLLLSLIIIIKNAKIKVTLSHQGRYRDTLQNLYKKCVERCNVRLSVFRGMQQWLPISQRMTLYHF